MHDGMPYGRYQGQGQGHSREVDRQSPTGLIFVYVFVNRKNKHCYKPLSAYELLGLHKAESDHDHVSLALVHDGMSSYCAVFFVLL